MNNLKFIILAIGVVALNLILSIFNGGIGMFIAPLVLSFVTLTITFGVKRVNPIFKVTFMVSLFIMHDIIFRVYSYGHYDQVGETLVQISFLLGVSISLIILILDVFLKKNEVLYQKLFSIFIYISIITLYFYLFKNLGPDWRFYNL